LPNSLLEKEVILITTHRRENFGKGLEEICSAIKYLAEKFTDHYFIFPVHFNPVVRNSIIGKLSNISNLKLIDPVDYDVCLYLQSMSKLIITDSGGIQEEAPTFSVPTVVIRETTERIEGITQGFGVVTGLKASSIIEAAQNYLLNDEFRTCLKNKPNPYGDGKAANRIVRILTREYGGGYGKN
jgi:UDP-N-acetylglucosamine 2-epimerase (non-hydrolysing)